MRLTILGLGRDKVRRCMGRRYRAACDFDQAELSAQASDVSRARGRRYEIQWLKHGVAGKLGKPQGRNRRETWSCK
jgi:hypothetical protein